MLFIDYSSAFNPIVPSKLIIKLDALGLNSALCNEPRSVQGTGRLVRIVGKMNRGND